MRGSRRPVTTRSSVPWVCCSNSLRFEVVAKDGKGAAKLSQAETLCQGPAVRVLTSIESRPKNFERLPPSCHKQTLGAKKPAVRVLASSTNRHNNSERLPPSCHIRSEHSPLETKMLLSRVVYLYIIAIYVARCCVTLAQLF